MSDAEKWLEDWPRALNLWGRYIKLQDPSLTRRKRIPGKKTATPLAYIDLEKKQVVVGLSEVERLNLEDFRLEILAHEIGHHVFAPGDLLDAARCMARIQRALREYSAESGLILNLYTDLLINHRLQSQGLVMDQIYARINQASQGADQLWSLYMRIYEILWSLSPGTLTEKVESEMEGDAAVAAQVIRSFATDIVRGSGMFAAICYYYLKADGSAATRTNMKPLLDSEHVSSGDIIPDGLVSMEEGEEEECSYPDFDENGQWKSASDTDNAPEGQSKGDAEGQSRIPLDYYNILKAMGIEVSQEQATNRFYREKARPYLIPFPVAESQESTEPLLEGYEIWQPGQMLERINWFQTLMRSPVVIPGYTTVQNRYGTSEGQREGQSPIDLDIYVDCSGSMPRPSMRLSYPALAGTIVALSALRTGSSVQATLWSGPNQVQITDGFVRDEDQILSVLTGYIGGGTSFPLQILRKTYLEHPLPGRKVHILVISDYGVDTMLQNDELGNSGKDIARKALECAGGGGTFALELYTSWEQNKRLKEAASLGFNIHSVTSAQELTGFARRFVQENYRNGKSIRSTH
ncbi:MAG: vWA domain-containing protein [Leptospiraceae bacterium]